MNYAPKLITDQTLKLIVNVFLCSYFVYLKFKFFVDERSKTWFIVKIKISLKMLIFILK